MWTKLNQLDQLDQLTANSSHQAQVIFKHSTRCSISRVALGRFDRNDSSVEETTYHLLDLLEHRTISNAISERFGVEHESPQVLIIRNGNCIYHASHLDIEPGEIEEKAGMN